jgi:hypothetical protein
VTPATAFFYDTNHEVFFFRDDKKKIVLQEKKRESKLDKKNVKHFIYELAMIFEICCGRAASL